MSRPKVFHLLLLFSIFLTMTGSPTNTGKAQTVMNSVPAETLGVALGVHLRPSTIYGSDLLAFNSQIGMDSAILMYFTDFTYGNDPYLHNSLTSKIADVDMPAIMLTLEPKNGRQSNGCDRDYPGFIGYGPLLAGKCDAFLRSMAAMIAERNETRFLIRFAHEMNLSDSPFWPGHEGKGAEDYIQLYRHVHQVLSAELAALGADNAEFVWSPNYFSQPAEPWNYYYNYYPGDTYVDWIGLSGYNWYPYNNQPDRSFQSLFGDLDGTDAYYSDQGFHPGILYDISCRYAKPIILTEFGAAHHSGTVSHKVQWIQDSFSKLAFHPFVRGVVWFNDFAHAGSTIDFRVTDVAGAITTAYSSAVQQEPYTSSLPALEDATPPDRYCWTDSNKAGQASFQLSHKRAILERSDATGVVLTGIMFDDDPVIAFEGLPAGVNAVVVDDNLFAPWGEASLAFRTTSSTAYGEYPVAVQVTSGQNTIRLPITVQVVRELHQISLPLVRR